MNLNQDLIDHLARRVNDQIALHKISSFQDDDGLSTEGLNLSFLLPVNSRPMTLISSANLFLVLVQPSTTLNPNTTWPDESGRDISPTWYPICEHVLLLTPDAPLLCLHLITSVILLHCSFLLLVYVTVCISGCLASTSTRVVFVLTVLYLLDRIMLALCDTECLCHVFRFH